MTIKHEGFPNIFASDCYRYVVISDIYLWQPSHIIVLLYPKMAAWVHAFGYGSLIEGKTKLLFLTCILCHFKFDISSLSSFLFARKTIFIYVSCRSVCHCPLIRRPYAISTGCLPHQHLVNNHRPDFNDFYV